MENYIVVLFKNKKRKKIIKKFVTLTKAKNFYKKLLDQSSQVIFNVEVENGLHIKYELGIVELSKNKLFPVYLTDEMGRNIRVKLEDEDMTLFEISPYKKEEKIFDIQKNKKIKVFDFFKNYLKNDTLKILSVLNNKVIIQKDFEINLFSLKNEEESIRFLETISDYFMKNKRSDCLFIKDTSSPQKKYLLKLLEDYGIDKKILYRKVTTYPRST